MKGLFRYPIVAVKWLDANARQPAVEYLESEIPQVHKAEPVITLGLLIQNDEAGVTLYNEETGPDSIRGVSFIPAKMIQDIIHIKASIPRKKKEEPVPQSEGVL